MIVHDLRQGTPEWNQFRLEHFAASEAAAMLGLSTKVTRNELLHMKHTMQPKEYSDWVENVLFANGHEVEELTRPLVEAQYGDEFYPVVCSDGKYSASCDGLTIDELNAWECKQWNESLAESVRNGFIPEEHQPQCQQVLMVTGAQQLVFTVSDGTDNKRHDAIIYPDEKWFKRIKDGWAQFAVDLDNYVPKDLPEKPQAEAIMRLPALSIQIKGEVTTSNLPQFKADAEAFIENINTNLKTDEDFSNAEANVKYCKDTEDSLEAAKKAAIAQTASIDEVMRTIDFIKDQLRTKRLDLDKKVKTEKANIKAKIILDAKKSFDEFISDLSEQIKPIRLDVDSPHFDSATKNKRTLESLHNAVDTELARCKIMANEIVNNIRRKLDWFNEIVDDNESLFPDISNIIYKPIEDFTLLVNTRIEDQKRKVEEAAEQKIIDDAEAAKKLTEKESVEEKTISEPQQTRTVSGPVKVNKSTNSSKEIAIKAATESLAAIIESTPAKHDLSTVIIKAIAEGKITNVTIQY